MKKNILLSSKEIPVFIEEFLYFFKAKSSLRIRPEAINIANKFDSSLCFETNLFSKISSQQLLLHHFVILNWWHIYAK